MARRFVLTALSLLLFLLAGRSFGQSLPRAGTFETAQADSQGSAFNTALQYVAVFYPRWFTYEQSSVNPNNHLFGPDHMSPVFAEVVAPNDDTLYVSGFMDLTEQPVILTIPPTTDTYSLLTLDAYGDIFQTNIQSPIPNEGTPGTYGLTGPGWSGTLPPNVTPIPVPVVFSQWIIRADKYSSDGVNEILEAEKFRRSLRAAPLSDYLLDATAGRASIVPVRVYSKSFKVTADDMIGTDPMNATDPITFLTQLQMGVHAATTPPLSPYEQQVSDAFDQLFGNPEYTLQLVAGAQAAHTLILDRYYSNTGPTNWITFTNIGAWGSDYVDRSAITEFIQYGNGHSTAVYYQAFNDVNGNPLDASTSPGYILTFPADQIPQARRFWSVTAYIPQSITLVDNSANKYVVGSYTPGLQKNGDGSISIYMFPQLPQGVAMANWLPVPQGPFNVMLRVYGPEGSVADGAYVPPGVDPAP